MIITGTAGAFRFAWHWEEPPVAMGGAAPVGEPIAIPTWSARSFFARLAGEPGSMMRMRRFLAAEHPVGLERLDDAEVLELLATWTARGRLHIRRLPLVSLTSFGDRAEEAPDAPPPSAARPEPEPEPVVVEAPALPELDVEALVGALAEAAKSAVPFCEICEPPRRPEAPVLPGVNAAEQARALTEAARTGAPFCEICKEPPRQKSAQETHAS